MAVAAVPILPAASVKVTLKVKVPSGSAETFTPVISCAAEVTLPLPVTEVVPLLPLLVMV